MRTLDIQPGVRIKPSESCLGRAVRAHTYIKHELWSDTEPELIYGIGATADEAKQHALEVLNKAHSGFTAQERYDAMDRAGHLVQAEMPEGRRYKLWGLPEEYEHGKTDRLRHK